MLLIAIICSGLAVVIHAYLTNSWINLHYGFGGEGSLCNINAIFNCDAVSISSFSHISNIPIAAFGLFANLVLTIFILGYRYGEKSLSYRMSFYLASASVFTSIAMGIISTLFLKTFCIFCIATYILSFIIFYALKVQEEELNFGLFKEDITEILNTSKSYLFTLLAIPVGAFILTDSMAGERRDQSLSYTLNVVGVWEKATKYDFSSTQESFNYGASSNIKMEIVEFADFYCGHCKNAAHPLHNFAQSREGVSLKFFHFPLDANCNPAIKRPGKSCKLAYTSFCAEKLSQKGSQVTMYLFDNQGKINPSNVIEKVSGNFSIEKNTLESCVNSDETKEIIQQQAKLGTKSGVQGTPSIYINGRLVRGAQMIPVLDALYRYITR